MQAHTHGREVGPRARAAGPVAPSPPASARRDDSDFLRQLGNQALQHRASSKTPDTNDSLEHAADLAADQSSPTSPTTAAHDDTAVRPLAAGHPVPFNHLPSTVERAVNTPGRPLDAAVRRDMERKFGYDFSTVRIHTDRIAARSAGLLGADAYTAGSDIAFAHDAYDPTTSAGRGLLAHELTHVVQQSMRPVETVQLRGSHDPQLASIQGLTMPDLLTCLDSLSRDVLTDEEAGHEVGGSRLVVAMRAVRARREIDIVSFAQTNAALMRAIPADQSADILRFLAMPREQEAENVNLALEVPVAVLKASGLRLRGESTGEQSLDDGESMEAMSDFESRILRDRNLILGAVLDPDSHDIIGYQVPGTTGLRRIVDRSGVVAFQSEVGLESPLLDPIDFLPSPGTVGKAAIGVGTKIAGKVAAKAAAGSGAKAASTLPLGAILKLRRVSKAIATAAGKATGKTVFGAGKTLLRPRTAIPLKAAAGKIDEQLLSWAAEGRTKLVNAAVDWGKSNVVTAKVLVDGKVVPIIVNNPEWALHAEQALIVEVEKLGKNRTVQVLQVFSERIPCGDAYAGCLTKLTRAYPSAEIFYGVSGNTLEPNVRALYRLYGLIP